MIWDRFNDVPSTPSPPPAVATWRRKHTMPIDFSPAHHIKVEIERKLQHSNFLTQLRTPIALELGSRAKRRLICHEGPTLPDHTGLARGRSSRLFFAIICQNTYGQGIKWFFISRDITPSTKKTSPVLKMLVKTVLTYCVIIPLLLVSAEAKKCAAMIPPSLRADRSLFGGEPTLFCELPTTFCNARNGRGLNRGGVRCTMNKAGYFKCNSQKDMNAAKSACRRLGGVKSTETIFVGFFDLLKDGAGTADEGNAKDASNSNSTVSKQPSGAQKAAPKPANQIDFRKCNKGTRRYVFKQPNGNTCTVEIIGGRGDFEGSRSVTVIGEFVVQNGLSFLPNETECTFQASEKQTKELDNVIQQNGLASEMSCKNASANSNSSKPSSSPTNQDQDDTVVFPGQSRASKTASSPQPSKATSPTNQGQDDDIVFPGSQGRKNASTPQPSKGQSHQVSVRVFVHENSLDGHSEDEIREIIRSDFDKLINQAFDREPTLGAKRLSFTHDVQFITESQFSTQGMDLYQILRNFSTFVRNHPEMVGGNDMTMIVSSSAKNGIAGLSPVGGPLRKCTGSQFGGTLVVFPKPWVGNNGFGHIARHELGHYFGAPHDKEGKAARCPQVGDIMGGNSLDKNTWSTCSSELIQARISSLESQACFSK
ncbi:uncharacterized protein VTP21DRAFT_11370 [Calcarisporiella thermophila]|uniref:uncharacterized protein n=1 Tax=Calcarisporiella thermophila TaxID=911321 RepID=UPI003742D6F4